MIVIKELRWRQEMGAKAGSGRGRVPGSSACSSGAETESIVPTMALKISYFTGWYVKREKT